MKNADEGFIIKDANLNDIFQFLAKSAGRQYFHNSKIGGPDFLVTGHLNDGKPLEQMEELAFMYGLSLHTKGNTIYALTQAQLAQLPSAEFHYQLRYLRPTDMEQIKELIKPLLSPGTGIVNFEPKTNTIIIIDSAHRIEQARELLHGIDKAKGQVIIETKILRVNSGAAERTGVNWANSLGKDGTSLTVASNLNSVFGLNNGNTSATDVGEALSEASLVLSPIQVSGVLRALAEGTLARQISNPALITEDNEQATISFIDRVPIITSTVTQNTSGGNPTVTEEVRYTIDQADPTMATDPDKHREIGISMVVTPTVLPDGTVRMKIRPRSAQIVQEILSLVRQQVSPRERVDDRIDRPRAGRLFADHRRLLWRKRNQGQAPRFRCWETFRRSISSSRARKPPRNRPASSSSSPRLPTIPPSAAANQRASRPLPGNATQIDCDHDWVNQDNPGPAHEANMKRTIRGLQPTQAPFYPRAEDLAPRQSVPAPAPSHSKSASGRSGNR